MTDPLLLVDQLRVRHRLKRATLFHAAQSFEAVRGVSFAIKAGHSLGLVGESGSGKTTLALALMQLLPASAGQIRFDGIDLTSLTQRQMRPLRQRLQMIFQDPYSSLDPRRRVGKSVAATLRLTTQHDRRSEREHVGALFAEVGLREDHLDLYPHQFSGGQRQRIAIARALAGRPRLIVCDEPVSALDAAVQAQILNLLRRLQDDYGPAYLFVSHDLAVVHYLCHDIAVMYLGRLVEMAPRQQLFSTPRHPYTRALLAAAPSLSRRKEGVRTAALAGEPPNPLEPPRGCSFASRCPYADKLCREIDPPLRYDDGHAVACHHA